MKKTSASKAVGAAWHAGFRRHGIAAALAAAFGTVVGPAWAQLPSGATVVNGTAGIATNGSRMTITNSQNAVLNWQAFSIGQQNSVRFEQPSASSQVLNRVVGNDPSNILGSLSSNGRVWLVNPHGVLFGSNSRIDVGGLVASTLAISNDDFLAGRFKFDGTALPTGQVLNRGEINTSFGGHVWLVGGAVRNEGLVRSPGGQIVLAAGKSVDMVDSGMPNVAVRVTAPDNEAINLGALLAPGGGSVDVHGGIVNQQGIVRADSVGTDPAGRVVIKASGEVQLGAASVTSASAEGTGSAGKILVESIDGASLVQGRASATSAGGPGGQVHLLGKNVGVYGQAVVDASGASAGGEVLAGGDYQGKNPLIRNAVATYFGPRATVLANAGGTGNGGKVIVWGDKVTRVYGTIAARGGESGGNGGFVETSGHVLDARTKKIDLAAPRGKAGTWLLDPGDIHIGACCLLDGVVVADSPDFDVSSVRDVAGVPASDIARALADGINVRISTGEGLETTQMGNIYVESDIIVPAGATPSGTFSLRAHNDIVMNAGTKIVGGSTPLSVSFLSDLDHDGVGNIRLRDGASIVTKGGDITLHAPADGAAPKGTILMDPNSSLDAGSGRASLNASTLAMSYGSAVTAKNIDVSAAGVLLVSASLHASDPSTGSVTINAGAISLDNSTINAPVQTTGVPALIDIGTGSLSMTNGSKFVADNIKLAAGSINLTDSSIRTNGFPDAAKGTAAITAGDIVLTRSELFSVGDMTVDTGTLTVTDSRMGNTHFGNNPQLSPQLGSVKINAGDISLTGSDLQSAGSMVIDTGSLAADNALINSGWVAINPANGKLTITAGEINLANSRLRSSGSMTIDTGTLTASRSNIASGLDATKPADGALDIVAGDISITDSTLDSSASGDAIEISTGRLTNSASQLTTPNGRWLVYLGPGYTAFPAADLGDLDYKFVQVNAVETTPTAVSGTGQHGILMADPLAVQIKVDATRPYDGTVKASFTEALSSNALRGFEVQPRASDTTLEGTFADKNAGVDKPITYNGNGVPFRIVTSTGAPVYGAEQSYVGDIVRKSVSASGFVADNKIYDGTRLATLHGSVSGIVAGDNVVLGDASGLFDTKNVGTGKTVTISGGSLSGTDAGNYALTAGASTTTADITAKPISIGELKAESKEYNGFRDATVHGTLSGIVAGDNVALDGATGLFDTKNAGRDKTVTLSGGSLAGIDAGNYALTGGATTTTANITPRSVTIAMTGQVTKEYDATVAANLGGVQFALDGLIANDAVAVRGPAQGSYNTPDVGEHKLVSAGGPFEFSGADVSNYQIGNIKLSAGAIANISASGNIGSVTPATLTFTATTAVREPGLPVTGLDGTVTGFKGTDSLSSATTGVLQWQSNTTLQSPTGAYAINGAGLNSTNYRLVQAPENATALVMKVDYSPNKPQAQAQQSSVLATNSALQSAIPPIDPRGSGGGVFDRSAPGAAKTFSAIRIGSMNQDELAQMLAARREFKRKLFADAIYKLEIDPSLADVQPCATPADASSGACQLTASQLMLMRATKPQTAPLANAVHAKAASLPQIERKVIVLFGINNYDDKTIPALENAIPDVDAVAKIFAEKLGYEVRVVRNPNKADIIRTLNALATEMNSNDSVVVYYAGHGYSLEKNGAGYWLPSDAKASDPRGWISNSDVAKLLSGVSAKQMALISDSCYSGAFAREGMGAVGHDVGAADILNKRSVVVLSSGGDEPVADEGKDGHSIFAWNLMQVVGTVKDWKPGSTIFTNIESGVRKEFPQTPKYGSVTAAGHQPGGDYLFEFR